MPTLDFRSWSFCVIVENSADFVRLEIAGRRDFAKVGKGLADFIRLEIAGRQDFMCFQRDRKEITYLL